MFAQLSLLTSIFLLMLAILYLAMRPRVIRHRRRYLDMQDDVSSEVPIPSQMSEEQILADPRVQKALAEGRVVDATRRIRRISGMGVQQSRDLVARYASR